MANHTARAALAACLVAAAAAAQAPASEDTRLRGFELRDDWGAPGAQAPQGEDYSLHRLFQEHHGDFMNRRERFTPQIDLRASLLPNQRIRHEPGHFDMLGYGLDIDAPILVSTDGYLKIGTYAHGRHYQYSSQFGTRGNASGLGDESLYAIGVKLGFGVFLSDNVLLEVESAPGVWSDLDGGLHHEDYDYPSFATVTVRATESLFFKIGARYNQVYEDAPYLPVLGMNVEIVDGFRFDLSLPEHLEFSFWPSAATGILVGAEITGAEYHVRTSLAGQEANPPGRDNLRVQEIVTYLGLLHRMNDYTSFTLRAGAVVAGDYDLTSGANGFNNAEGSLSGGFFADFSFGVNF
ncbi:MAG: hypothetical protein JNM25_17720 [Planctomycetes bacterium]|nr:hypothetical protein [Planctomycetota bacterium]